MCRPWSFTVDYQITATANRGSGGTGKEDKDDPLDVGESGVILSRRVPGRVGHKIGSSVVSGKSGTGGPREAKVVEPEGTEGVETKREFAIWDVGDKGRTCGKEERRGSIEGEQEVYRRSRSRGVLRTKVEGLNQVRGILPGSGVVQDEEVSHTVSLSSVNRPLLDGERSRSEDNLTLRLFRLGTSGSWFVSTRPCISRESL